MSRSGRLYPAGAGLGLQVSESQPRAVESGGIWAEVDWRQDLPQQDVEVAGDTKAGSVCTRKPTLRTPADRGVRA